ncbi:unnamed protein product [Oikopleura dioica]|uniref:Uncharacterized protein n=1 Tax=Oikopleura dioica TaxID=34765 RepID=E4X3S5_OIKDI|nr:unnamed protein product [Oikopleura dioica]
MGFLRRASSKFKLGKFVDGNLVEHIMEEQEVKSTSRSFVEAKIDGELHYLFPRPAQKYLGKHEGTIISLRRTPKGYLLGLVQNKTDGKNYRWTPKNNEKALKWQNCEPYKSKPYSFCLFECTSTGKFTVKNLERIQSHS